MMMILGYSLSSSGSNEAYFFNADEPSGVLCHHCGSCLDYRQAPAVIDIQPSRKYDVSYTFDRRLLFSEKFVTFCRNMLHSDENFMPIWNGRENLFYMFPSRVLEFDVVRRRVRFEKSCKECGGYESVVGAVPSFLKTSQPIGLGFFRSDVAFGSGKGKFPLFIVGAEWKELLLSQKFRGLTFHEITD